MRSDMIVSVVAMVALVAMVKGADKNRALLIVDVQNCFTKGGTLEVAGGDEVIPVLNTIRAQHADMFSLVMLSQDWHCDDHISFASQHEGMNIYDVIDLHYNHKGELCKTNETLGCDTIVEQVLWPDHCVINTTDAAYSTDLSTEPTDVLVQKGYNCDLDSYSVFYDNGHLSETSARAQMQDANITDVYITGLATDYCVYWSAKDALNLGFETYVIVDAARPVANDTGDAALEDMEKLGVHLITSASLDQPTVDGDENNAARGLMRSSVNLLTFLLLIVCVQ